MIFSRLLRTFSHAQRRAGYIAILGLAGIVAASGVFTTSLLNVRWVESNKQIHAAAARVMAAGSMNTYIPPVPSNFYKTDQNMVWLTFLSENIASMREMVKFPANVKAMRKESVNYINDTLNARAIYSGVDINKGRRYGYMQMYKDSTTEFQWIIPVLKNIQDDEIMQYQTGIKRSVGAFVTYSKLTRQFYGEKLPIQERDIVSFYGREGRFNKFRNQLVGYM